MNYNDIDIAFRKNDELEKKVEIYYKKLDIENELGFILNGKYCTEEDITKILEGNYALLT